MKKTPLALTPSAWAAAFLIAIQGLAGVAPAHAQTAQQPSVGASLPSLGDGAEMSLGAERRLGDRIAREIYRDPAYLDDPVLVEYVQGIWLRLMAAARQRGELSPEMDERYAWGLLLGRDRTVNAFALPGGYMGVHLGLIAVVSSEDELASVLGHELSHITQRHLARMFTQQANQAPLMLAAMILGALAIGSNPQAGSALIVGGSAAATQTQLNFSRDMEREADRVGYGVATQAGFAPQGFVGMFEKLQQASRLNDNGAYPYLRSHPLTTERLADMQARQQLLPPAPPLVLTPQHAMLAARARVLSNDDVDSLRARVTEAGSATLQPLSLGARAGVLYAGALAAQLQRDFAQANRLVAALQRLVQAQPEALRLVALLGAELALAENEPARALAWLPATATPTLAPSRAVLFLRAQALSRSGQGADAAQQLREWLAMHPRDAQAWQWLSVALAAQGKTLGAVRAEAEVFAAELDFQAALNRMRAAQELVQKAGAPDLIEASIIDTRLRELTQRTKEQALER